MKQIIALFFMSTALFACPIRPDARFVYEECDVCGCSATGGSMGLSSLISPNFIGVRYMHQQYSSKDGVFNNSPWINENFNTVQLWGKYPVSTKWDVMAMVPYHFNSRQKQTGTQEVHGMGDISAFVFYNAIQSSNFDKKLATKLQVGLGVKMPTGTYNQANNGSINPSFQLGTGSWDYTLATDFTFTKNKAGANAMLQYVFKTENKKAYQFGNQLNYGVNFFYNAQLSNLKVLPQMGITGEVYTANENYKEKVPLTSGAVLFTKLAVEVAYRKWAFGAQAQLPIQQNLMGGKVEARHRIGLNVNYSL